MQFHEKVKLMHELLGVLEQLNSASKALDGAMKTHKEVCKLPGLLPEQEAKARDDVHSCVDALLDLGLKVQKITLANPELRK